MGTAMMRRIVFGTVVFSVAIGAAILSAQEDAKKPPTRSEFMRMKLDFSKKVLEGLTMENYDSIAKNAKALKRLSEAAEWEVPTIPNAGDYVVFTTEFQRLADEMERKAKDKNIDGATLAYLRLTMNCVSCHKYVRQITK